MAQFIRPIADVDGGSWSTSPFFSKIDEDIGGGGNDVTIASDAVGNNVDTTDLDLEGTNSGTTDPAVSTAHILRVLWASTITRDMTGHFELWQGIPDVGTLIAEATVELVDATEVETAYTLSGAEADSITDYNDLYFALWGRGTGGGPNRSLVVDAAEFELPDAGGDTFVTVTEDVGVTDVVSRIHGAVRIRSEPLGVTDETVVKQGKALVEDVGVTDLVEPKLTIASEVTEDVGVTDTVLPVKTIRIEITEAIGVTDAPSRALITKRTVAEPVGVTDETPVKQSKEIVEPVGLTDDTEIKLVIAQEIVEAIGLTDQINAARDLARVISEPVGVTDEIPIKQSKEIVEAVGILDVVLDDLTAGQLTEVITEAIGLTDVVLPARTIRVVITESIGVSDELGIKQGIEIVEVLGVTDEISKAVGVEVVEPVGISDTTSRVVDATRIIVEPVGILDVPSRDLDTVREIVETVGLSDLVLDSLSVAGALWWRKDPVSHTKNPVPFRKVPPGAPTPW